MKLLILLACGLIAIGAICQEQPTDRRLHILASGLGANLTADSIERDAPTLKWAPSVIRMRGNVEIRKRFAISLPEEEKSGATRSVYLIVRADEADYDEQTGEIVPRGNVRITVQPPK